MRLLYLMAVLALIGLTEAACAGRPAVAPSIEIRVAAIRPDAHGEYICAGICPGYRLTVDPTGFVFVHASTGEEYRYVASASQLEQFRQWLSTEVPQNGARSIYQMCGAEPVIHIRWTPESGARPAFCVATPSPGDNIFRAIDALGVNAVNGLPFTDLESVRKIRPVERR